MTLQEALDDIRQALKDTATDTTRQRRSNSVLVTKMNQASKAFVRHTKCLNKEGTLTLTSALGTASMPTDFLCFAQDDLVGGRGIIILNNQSLDYKAPGYMDKMEDGWRAVTSATPDSWHLKDLSTIRFNCTLSAAAAAYTAIIRYIRQPATLSAASLDAEILEGIPALSDFSEAVTAWVKAKCKREDGMKEEADTMDPMWMGAFEQAKEHLSGMLSMRGPLKADPAWTSGWQRPPES